MLAVQHLVCTRQVSLKRSGRSDTVGSAMDRHNRRAPGRASSFSLKRWPSASWCSSASALSSNLPVVRREETVRQRSAPWLGGGGVCPAHRCPLFAPSAPARICSSPGSAPPSRLPIGRARRSRAPVVKRVGGGVTQAVRGVGDAGVKGRDRIEAVSNLLKCVRSAVGDIVFAEDAQRELCPQDLNDVAEWSQGVAELPQKLTR